MRKLDFLNFANHANKLSAGQFEPQTNPSQQTMMLKTKFALQPLPANKTSKWWQNDASYKKLPANQMSEIKFAYFLKLYQKFQQLLHFH